MSCYITFTVYILTRRCFFLHTFSTLFNIQWRGLFCITSYIIKVFVFAELNSISLSRNVFSKMFQFSQIVLVSPSVLPDHVSSTVSLLAPPYVATLYLPSPHWTLDSVQCAVNSVQCTVYTVHCTMYTVHCTLYTSLCTV